MFWLLADSTSSYSLDLFPFLLLNKESVNSQPFPSWCHSECPVLSLLFFVKSSVNHSFPSFCCSPCLSHLFLSSCGDNYPFFFLATPPSVSTCTLSLFSYTVNLVPPFYSFNTIGSLLLPLPIVCACTGCCLHLLACPRPL